MIEQNNEFIFNPENYPKNEKGNYIVPDEILEKYYKQLPDGTVNESKTKRAFNNGLLSILGSNPEAEHEIHVKGGKALQATIKQRRTIAETIDIALRKKADSELIDKYGLDESATYQDAIVASMMQAAAGDQQSVKAAEFLRDTVGEKPVNREEISAEVTNADIELINKVKNRLSQ